MSFSLAHVSWPDLPERPLVLVPLGSTEQHGPHLPFSTDSLVATAVADGISAVLTAQGRAVVVAPTVPYGASGEHQAFPGTSSIGEDALVHLLVELVRSLTTWAGGIVLVNGHGGNITSLARAVPQLIAEDHLVSWVPCTLVDGDAHAGRTETSLMLLLRPELAQLTKSVPGNTTAIIELLPLLRTKGVRELSPTGILGDPTGAHPGEGAWFLEQMIASARLRLESGVVDERGCRVVAG